MGGHCGFGLCNICILDYWLDYKKSSRKIPETDDSPVICFSCSCGYYSGYMKQSPVVPLSLVSPGIFPLQKFD